MLDGATIVAQHPINNGKVIATLALGGAPALISVRPSAFQPTFHGPMVVLFAMGVVLAG